MSTRYSILERILWLLLLATLVFFPVFRRALVPAELAAFTDFLLSWGARGKPWDLALPNSDMYTLFEAAPYPYLWAAEFFEKIPLSPLSSIVFAALPLGLLFLSLSVWTWIRMGWFSAVVACGTMAISFVLSPSHLNPVQNIFSLSVGLLAIATYELHWRERTRFRRPGYWFIMLTALWLGVASRGLGAVSAWAGLSLSLAYALIFSPRDSFRVFFSLIFQGLTYVLAILPAALWAWQVFRQQGPIVYIRAVEPFLIAISMGQKVWLLSEPSTIFRKILNEMPWPLWGCFGAWLSLVVAPLLSAKFEAMRPLRNPAYRGMSWNALAFALALCAPAMVCGLSRTYYFHGVYFLLGTVSASFAVRMLPGHVLVFVANAVDSPKIRWIALVGLAGVQGILK